jgi:hypothetical protein
VDLRSIRWDLVRLAGEVVLGLLAWYLLWLSYPLENVFPIYGRY